jgi:putative membrane protein
MTNLFIYASVAQPGPWCGPGGWGGWWWLMPLTMWLFWAAVIALIVWFVRNRRETNETERARGILAERYARGEIDANEYHERLERLR